MRMQKDLGKDLSTGSIPRHLLHLAVPMLLGNVLNIGYSVVNTIWVGNILGANAVAASAVTWPVFFILIAVAAGATIASTILVSQNFGAKNFEMVRSVVDTSLLLALILGLVLTAIGIIAGDGILRLMDTPAAVFPLASPYLKIGMLSFVVQYLLFLLAAILRGIGDTKTPLIFMVAGVVINAILDPLLIMGIPPFPKLGLNGAAWASVISSFCALAMGIVYLNKKSDLVRFRISHLSVNWGIIGKIYSIGFPSMIQQSLVSVSAAFITTFVNAFGASATAAFGAAGRIDSIAFMPIMSVMMSVTTLTGQNLGAGKPERVRLVFLWGIRMTLAITAVLVLAMVLVPKQMLAVFIKDKIVIDLGAMYLRIVGPSYLAMSFLFVSNGVINGAGKTLITLFFTFLSLWIIRVPCAAFLSHTSLGLNGVWIAIDIGIVVAAGVSLAYYFSGHWKRPGKKALIREAA
jgi:putative MATE family efflux protein